MAELAAFVPASEIAGYDLTYVLMGTMQENFGPKLGARLDALDTCHYHKRWTGDKTVATRRNHRTGDALEFTMVPDELMRNDARQGYQGTAPGDLGTFLCEFGLIDGLATSARLTWPIFVTIREALLPESQ